MFDADEFHHLLITGYHLSSLADEDHAGSAVHDDLPADPPANVFGDNRDPELFQHMQSQGDVPVTDHEQFQAGPGDIGSPKNLGDQMFTTASNQQHLAQQLFHGDVAVLWRCQPFTVPEGQHHVIHPPSPDDMIPQTNGNARTKHGADLVFKGLGKDGAGIEEMAVDRFFTPHACLRLAHIIEEEQIAGL